MKKNLLYAGIASLVLTSSAFADVQIVNSTSSPIRVYLRAHDTHHKEKVYQEYDIGAGQNARLAVDRKMLKLAKGEYYALIASKTLNDTIDPDWRLLAGECSKLPVNHDVTVEITEHAGGVKTSCKVLGTN